MVASSVSVVDGLYAPGHNAPRPELEDLSNEDLVDSIFNPADGQAIKVKGNTVLDGNGRLKEAKKRGLFSDGDLIPVDELHDDEERAPWENDSDGSDGDEMKQKESKEEDE